MSTAPAPRCPVCNRQGCRAGQLWRCPQHGLFDDDPDEGGTHSDRNPAERMERAEQRPKRRPATNYHPRDWNN